MTSSGRLAALLIALVALPGRCSAGEERPRPSVELEAGAMLFADDGVVGEGFVGGSARFYVLPRLGVGPEIAFVQGERHDHLILAGNVTIDWFRPVSGRPPSVTPYTVVGVGVFRTREAFPNNEVFTSSEGAFTAGGGVRARLGRYVTVGAEARVGWELHVRLNGTIGIQLRK